MTSQERVKLIKEKLEIKSAAIVKEHPSLEGKAEAFLEKCFDILDKINHALPKNELQDAFTDAKDKINVEINNLLMEIVKEK